MSQFKVDIVTQGDLQALNNLEILTRKQLDSATQLKRQYDQALPTLTAGSAAHTRMSEAVRALDTAIGSQTSSLIQQQEALRNSAISLEALGTAASKAAAETQRVRIADISQQLGQSVGPLNKVKESLLSFRQAYRQAGGGLDGLVSSLQAGAGSWLAWGYAAKKAADVARAAVRDFSALEDQVTAVNESLARNGKMTATATEAYRGLAEVMEGRTNVAMEQWLAIMARLTDLGAGEKSVSSLALTIENLAGVMGGSVPEASGMMFSALEGNFESLEKFGIFVQSNENYVLRLNDAMEQINAKGAGVMAARMGDISSLTKEAGLEIKGMSRELGSLLEMPVKFILTGFTDSLKFVNSTVGKTIGLFKDMAAPLKAVTSLFPDLTAHLKTFERANSSAAQSRVHQIKASENFTRQMKVERDAILDAQTAHSEYNQQVRAEGNAQLELLNAKVKLDIAKVDAAESRGLSSNEANRRRINIRTDAGNERYAIERQTGEADIEASQQGITDRNTVLNRMNKHISTAQSRVGAARELQQYSGRTGALADEARGGVFAKFGISPDARLLGPQGVTNAEAELKIANARNGPNNEERRRMEREIRQLTSAQQRQVLDLAVKQQIRGVEARSTNLTNQTGFSKTNTQYQIQERINDIDQDAAEREITLKNRNATAQQKFLFQIEGRREASEKKILAVQMEVYDALQSGSPAKVQIAKRKIEQQVMTENEGNRDMLDNPVVRRNYGHIRPFRLADFAPEFKGTTEEGRGLVQAQIGRTTANRVMPTLQTDLIPSSTGFLSPQGNAGGDTRFLQERFVDQRHFGNGAAMRQGHVGVDYTTGPFRRSGTGYFIRPGAESITEGRSHINSASTYIHPLHRRVSAGTIGRGRMLGTLEEPTSRLGNIVAPNVLGGELADLTPGTANARLGIPYNGLQPGYAIPGASGYRDPFRNPTIDPLQHGSFGSGGAAPFGYGPMAANGYGGGLPTGGGFPAGGGYAAPSYGGSHSLGGYAGSGSGFPIPLPVIIVGSQVALGGSVSTAAAGIMSRVSGIFGGGPSTPSTPSIVSNPTSPTSPTTTPATPPATPAVGSPITDPDISGVNAEVQDVDQGVARLGVAAVKVAALKKVREAKRLAELAAAIPDYMTSMKADAVKKAAAAKKALDGTDAARGVGTVLKAGVNAMPLGDTALKYGGRVASSASDALSGAGKIAPGFAKAGAGLLKAGSFLGKGMKLVPGVGLGIDIIEGGIGAFKEEGGADEALANMSSFSDLNPWGERGVTGAVKAAGQFVSGGSNISALVGGFYTAGVDVLNATEGIGDSERTLAYLKLRGSEAEAAPKHDLSKLGLAIDRSGPTARIRNMANMFRDREDLNPEPDLPEKKFVSTSKPGKRHGPITRNQHGLQQGSIKSSAARSKASRKAADLAGSRMANRQTEVSELQAQLEKETNPAERIRIERKLKSREGLVKKHQGDFFRADFESHRYGGTLDSTNNASENPLIQDYTIQKQQNGIGEVGPETPETSRLEAATTQTTASVTQSEENLVAAVSGLGDAVLNSQSAAIAVIKDVVNRVASGEAELARMKSYMENTMRS